MGSSSRNLYAGIGEGQSTSRPPLFDGTNYSYWKERMRIYIRSTNFQLWLAIKNGEETPMKKVGEKLVPKTEDEFDAEDIKKVENYAKAINMLYCAVNPKDYHKILCCTTTKEMLDKLEVTYEGTDQVREAKIDFLTQEYEMFRMNEGEKIDDMFDRFSKIINDLHALKKTYANKDLVRKILRSLTPEWRLKANAIYESIGVSNVTIDGLRGNLKTYEYTILTPSLNEQKKKGIALKETKETVEEASSDDDNEFGLVIKKFHKFMKKEFKRKGRKHDGPPKFYGCGEIGHIKPRCPKGKNGKDKPGFKKQRAYISWGGDSGDESTNQEEDEAANLCLMAHEDQTDNIQESPHVVFSEDNTRLARKAICDDLADSLERIHVEGDEEDTPIYTNPQPQTEETPQVMVENEEDQADKEKHEEAQEQEETELPVAWRTNKNHPLDQVIGIINRGNSSSMGKDKSMAATSGKSKAKSRAPTTTSEEHLYYGDRWYLWFDSEEERTRFLTFFSKRVVAPPRIVPERFEDLVKSTPIEITVERLGRIAGLPYQGDDIFTYGGEDWVLNNEGLFFNELGITELIRHPTGRPTIHSATPESGLLLYIVSRILKPRRHGHTIMSGEDLKLLHAIMHSAPINWAKFVMIYMTDATSTAHDQLLPYPFLVMDILKRFKVTTTVGPLTKATKIWKISAQTFKKRSNNAAVLPMAQPNPRPGPTLPPSLTPSTGCTSKSTGWTDIPLYYGKCGRFGHSCSSPAKPTGKLPSGGMMNRGDHMTASDKATATKGKRTVVRHKKKTPSKILQTLDNSRAHLAQPGEIPCTSNQDGQDVMDTLALENLDIGTPKVSGEALILSRGGSAKAKTYKLSVQTRGMKAALDPSLLVIS
ncbi:unnamed protein product [Cuscuta campestris]|uniref:CCHC-type domain-containing protein n=1 Tax=Cuscuta campestris TaxID=132261 RepID=A0A484LMS6_9ASTE|nr:unnamed protein product [Cuscuta campestris]